jgi:hypothetical protein
MSVRRLWTIAMLALAALVVPRAALAQTVTAAWTSATAQDAALQIGVGAPGNVAMSFNVTGGTITAGSLNFEISDDGNTWYGATCSRYSGAVVESSYSLNLATNQVWHCPVGGPMVFRVRLNPVLSGAGTANIRMNVSGMSMPSGVSGVSSLGNANGKTNQLKTNNLVTTAATADQVVLTYTVTANKTLYLEYLELEGRLTVAAATATILGDVSIETPSGTKVITTTMVNPTTSAPDKVVIPFGEPIPISSGVVIRVVVTPTAVTSMTWKASFGGYEK